MLVLKRAALAPRKGAIRTCELNVERGGSHPHSRAPHITYYLERCSHPGRMERQRSGTQGPSWIWDRAQASHNHGEEHLPSRRLPQQGIQAPSRWLPPRVRGKFGEREHPGRPLPAGDGQALSVSPKEGGNLSDGAQ